MGYVLDSDIIIYLRKGRQNVVNHITSVHPKDIYTTVISKAELLSGAYYSERKKQNLSETRQFLNNIKILPFCDDSIEIFAECKALLKKKGTIIQDMDLMIASIAIANKMILVTNNTKHFNRIKNLKLENWAL